MAKAKRISLATFKAIEEHLLTCTGHCDSAILQIKSLKTNEAFESVQTQLYRWKVGRQMFAYAIEQARARIKKEQSPCPDNS